MLESHNIAKFEDTTIENAIKTDFGLEIKNAEKLNHGYDSQVYKTNLNDETAFIRINKEARVFEAEVLGYETFEQQEIPVPKIIAYKENPPSVGHPTMIMSSAIGTTISEANLTPEDEDIVFEKLGRLLHKINETKLEGYGPLVVKENKLEGQFSTWKDYQEKQQQKYLKDLNFCVEKGYLNDSESEKIKAIYNEIESLDIGKASFLHKDLHSSHFFVQGTDITGVIDLGGIMAGDPRYDVAMSLIFQNPRQQENFKKGYGNLANDPLVNKYFIVIALGKIRFRSREDIKGDAGSMLPKLEEALKKLG